MARKKREVTKSEFNRDALSKGTGRWGVTSSGFQANGAT